MATFVNDTFTDTDTTVLDSHTGEAGATWTDIFSNSAETIVINNNRVNGESTLAASWYRASGTAASADYSVQANFVYLSQATRMYVLGRIAVNNAATGSFNGYAWGHRAFTGWQLFRVDNGALTQIGSTFATELGSGDNKVGKLEMIGDQIKGYVDGVERASATDATYSASGFVGLGTSAGGGSSTTGVVLDNFSASDAGGGGRTTKNTRSAPLGMNIGMGFRMSSSGLYVPTDHRLRLAA